MTLHPNPIGTIPEETERVARAAFPKKNLYLQMRDELGTFFEDKDFESLFARRGQPAESPWRLALVSIMQFNEGLSDRQAAEAVRARIDWKYALGLELTDPGFDFSVLSEFRSRLLTGGAEELLLNKMLERFKAKRLLKAGGKQRTDSTHILAAVRRLNRLESVGETLRALLNELASANAEWLRAQITADWFERYGRRVEDYRLPKGEKAREEYAVQIGADGFHLLRALDNESTPSQLRELPAVNILRQMWKNHYQQEGDKIRWRAATELPPAGERFDSPYDIEAQFGKKRTKTWVGYKVHLTETCDKESAHIITEVETTSAVIPDVEMGEKIEQSLEEKELLPDQHLVDSGYVEAKFVIKSAQERGVKVIGPVRPDNHWQKRQATGYDLSQFQIDWDNKSVTCPAGVTTTSWYTTTNNNNNNNESESNQEWISARFKLADCMACPSRELCTKAKNTPRVIRLRPKPQYELLQATRKEQTTDEWKKQYSVRAGIEGTISQGVRVFGLRQSRYLGKAKSHLQNILIAAAINIVRVISWLNDIPVAKTRISRFAALATQS